MESERQKQSKAGDCASERKLKCSIKHIAALLTGLFIQVLRTSRRAN